MVKNDFGRKTPMHPPDNRPQCPGEPSLLIPLWHVPSGSARFSARARLARQVRTRGTDARSSVKRRRCRRRGLMRHGDLPAEADIDVSALAGGLCVW